MKVFDKEKFKKYVGTPVRVKSMGTKMVAIKDGAILATFRNLKQLRKYFPFNNTNPLTIT